MREKGDKKDLKKTHGMRRVLPEMGNLRICRMRPLRQLRLNLEVRAEENRGGQGQVGDLTRAGVEERSLKVAKTTVVKVMSHRNVVGCNQWPLL